MSDLGDLLELLHPTRDRSRSVRLGVPEWHALARSREAFARHMRRSQGVSFAQPTSGASTLVELSGRERDAVVALAAGLRPAPTEPPRLP